MLDDRVHAYRSPTLAVLRQGLCAVVLVGVLLGQAPSAYAQDETAQAKAHYVKGAAAFDAQDYEGALSEFQMETGGVGAVSEPGREGAL